MPLRPPFNRTGPRLIKPLGSTVLPIPGSVPETPNSPSPGDTATAYFTTLSWASAGATKFDILIDTVTPPVTQQPPSTLFAVPALLGFALSIKFTSRILLANTVIRNYVGTSYKAALLPGTKYYWQIVAYNGAGFIDGPIWSFTTPTATNLIFSIAGVITSNVRYGSLNIRDILGAAPNTARLIFDVPPPVGRILKIGLGNLDPTSLIFAGEIQQPEQSYNETPNDTVWSTNLVDHTFTINKRRPFGTWVNTSATTIAQYLAATYAPDFTTNNIQDGLPLVSISFDGSQDFMTCFSQLATAIGVNGFCKVDYPKDLHLSNVIDTVNVPDPLDASHPVLANPSPLRISTDTSQVRTRCYGIGHGENSCCDVSAGETIVPIVDAIMFNPNGGKAIAATTSNGARTQIFPYLGIQLGGGGTLVGPGVAPSVPPGVSSLSGIGLGIGTYQYAYTDVTASGESLPSPIATVVTGTLSPPLQPTATVSIGGLVDLGDHYYAVTFVTAVGETTPGTNSSPFTSGVSSPPSSAPLYPGSGNFFGDGLSLFFGSNYLEWAVTFVTSAGETTIGPKYQTIYSVSGSPPGGFFATETFPIQNIPTGPGGTIARKLYRATSTSGYGSTMHLAKTINDNTTTSINDDTLDVNLGVAAPSTNTARISTINLSLIRTGPSPSVIARNIYRTTAGGSQLKFLAQLSDNVSTTYSDQLSDAQLGANAPTSNTAIQQRVSLTSIVAGPSPTTSRKVYRTAVGASQLKLLTTISDNTTTTFTDNVADTSLGANAPTGDTSGLTQPTGQVNAGSTTLLTANATPFPSQGWVSLPGSQAIRYTGISGNTLTGIPASGPGSIITTVLYNSQVLPVPALTGVNQNNGVTLPLAKGSPVNIFVQRDDLAAQSILGQLELDDNGKPTDGIREYMIVDERRNEASLAAYCDADLAQFRIPTITIDFYTRDTKVKSGKTIQVNISQYSQQIITDLPASYWQLNESTGSAVDSVGPYIGAVSLTGVTRSVTGPLNDGTTAYLFDGVSGWISAAPSSAFNFAGNAPFSIEVWINNTLVPGPGPPTGLFTRVVHKVANDGSGKNGWHLFMGASDDHPNQIGFERWVNGTFDQVYSGVLLLPSTWHHVVATYDGRTMSMYIDGVLTNSTISTAALNSSSSGVGIARRGDVSASFFNGAIDEVAIYSYALNTVQISTHAALKTSMFSSSWNLAGPFMVQDVVITCDDPTQFPLRHVTISSVKFSLEDLWRRVVIK